jgi:DNA modification methylase
MATTKRHRLAMEHVAVVELRPDPFNPRRISDAELEALTRSIRQFGFVQPIVARREDLTVIGGHQRLIAARRVGLKTVPVVFVALSPEQAKLLNLALNRISGEWDEELLARLLAELQEVPEVDLSLSGFGDDEVSRLLKSLDAREKRDRPETFDVEAVLKAARGDPGVKRGDLWRLRDHRLLCGDATDAADVARLVEGQQAAMCFTDPPYDVDYGNHGGGRGHRRRAIANDALPPEEWEAFCRGWARQLIDHVDGALYICMSSKEWPTVCRILTEAGGHWSDTIIWAKDRFVLGRADYQRQYEPIWYGWPKSARRHWCGGRDQGDVWIIPRPAESDLHPTMKPLVLVERAIESSSRTSDLVLDLFLGSGTTVIAAERTGRVCYGVELDPHYCRVVIARWEAFTGLRAEKLSE